MGLGTTALFLVLQTSPVVDVADYVPNAAGDEWRYRNLAPDGLSPIVIRMAASAPHRGLTVARRDENNGDYRYQIVDREKGLQVYYLYFVGDQVVEFERPVTVFPGKLKAGDRHQSQSRYVYREKGKRKDVGLQTYEVEVEAFASVTTPAGAFADCLVTRTTALRLDFSGARKGYALREWHARGVGPVKVSGELFWKNESGVTTRTLKVDAELERALVGGRAVGR